MVPFAIIKIDQVYDVRIYIYVTSLPSFEWSKLLLVLLIALSFKGCRFKYGWVVGVNLLRVDGGGSTTVVMVPE